MFDDEKENNNPEPETQPSIMGNPQVLQHSAESIMQNPVKPNESQED